MNYDTLLKKIDSLENEIAKLPQGSISAKTIDNKKYYYHRTNINNKRVEKYINFNDVENLRIQIIKRKQLEEELKSLKKQLPKTNNKTNHQFHTYVQTNNQLLDLINTVKSYNYRECYATLSKYIFDMQTEKVLILYGLRRTGKTTLMRQILLNMTHDQLSKTAFIQINPNNTLFELNNDLQYLQKK